MFYILLGLLAIGYNLPANSQSADVHAKCLKASDYKGCVEVMTGGGVTAASPIKQLIESMKLLPSRMSNSSRASLYTSIQPFSDALSLAGSTERKGEYEEEVYNSASRISRLIDVMGNTWSDQISLRIKWQSYTEPVCENARQRINQFNAIAGKPVVSYYEYSETFLWQTTKRCSDPTVAMMNAITAEVQSATEDPEVKKAKLAKEKRQRELAEMEPWLRHLEENPGLKKWAESNPKAADAAKQKFLINNTNTTSGQGGASMPNWSDSFKRK